MLGGGGGVLSTNYWNGVMCSGRRSLKISGDGVRRGKGKGRGLIAVGLG